MEDTSVTPVIFLRGSTDYCHFPRIYSDVGLIMLSYLAPILNL